MSKKVLISGLFSISFIMHSVAFAGPVKRNPSSVERPPQFVLLAFDGSSSLEMWKETVSFAKTVKTMNTRNEKTTAKLTYFVNPVYYTESQYKDAYRTPILDRPYSCIKWASPAGSVLERVILTNNAFENGHEIGSHANSHCSADGSDESALRGKTWSEENWTSEFNQFNDLLFNALSINHIKPPADFVMKFKKENIVGFRAPSLATTPGLWPTLKKFGFKYDTSRSDKSTYWPQKLSWGGWNLPLATIKVARAGGTKTTFSMDYNWFVLQTGAASLTTAEKCKNDPDFSSNKWCKAGTYITDQKLADMKNQMLDSYKYYFKQNYFGSRAPVQIGHHFARWNGGAYWTAFKEFALEVCNKPEVKCVTMNEYVNWLDGLAATELAAYRAGQFTKLPNDNSIQDISDVVVPIAKVEFNSNSFKAVLSKQDQLLANSMNMKKQLSIDFKPVTGDSIKFSDLKKYSVNSDSILVRASVINRKGTEISWETYKVKNAGTPEQEISKFSVEHGATQPETAEAHNIEQ